MKALRIPLPKKNAGMIRLMICAISGLITVPASGQYFGRNKPGYSVFHYDVLRSPDFDLYHTFKNDSLMDELASAAEYWYTLHSKVFGDTLHERNPILIYEDQAEFQQTNVSSGLIGVGVGGFTEGLKDRVVMPVSLTFGQTNHVLGHELVHVFQYNLLDGDSLSMRNMNNIPLWMIEGLAEYISIGSIDPQTSMWIRDALLNNKFPSVQDLSRKPEYNPYRFGQAFWTFAARTWGDTIIAPLFKATARLGYKDAFKKILGMGEKNVSNIWKNAAELHFKSVMKDTVDSLVGTELISDENAGEINISPVISPNGKYVAFFSEKELFTIDLYLANAETGKIIKKLTSTVKNDEIDDFNFIESAGSWSPDSKKFAYVAFSKGRNKLIITDVKKDKITSDIDMKEIKSFSNPAWSPDGNRIVFTGSRNGIDNLYIYDLTLDELRLLTDDSYSYIHPAWSPDGKSIVFSTDRNIRNNNTGIVPNAFDLGILNIKTGNIKMLDLFPGAGNLNPVYSDDGTVIYFLSDRDGFRNLYKYTPENKKVYQLTGYLTGISGITLLSPAISISGDNRIVYSYFSDRKYKVYAAQADEFVAMEVDPMELNFEASTLSPCKRLGINIVDSVLSIQPRLQQLKEGNFKPMPYKPKFQLDYISNVAVGVATGRIGTGMAGSVSALFSDMVGDHQLFANLALNGEIYDFGGQVAYINQKKRINWGAGISHIPYLYGSYGITADTIDINGEPAPVNNYFINLYRMFESQLSVFGYLPISTTRRVEAGLSLSRYSYRIDRYSNYYDDLGNYLGQSRKKLEAPPGFGLVQTDVAYVYDKSYFGVTSPMKGARSRYGLMNYMGDFNFFTTLIDYRKYFFIKPITLAFRFYNYNKLGTDAENPRFAPLYIGYSWYIRGYDGTTGRNNFIPELTFNQLQGSRMIVTNAEIRIPFTGPKRLSLIKSRFLLTDVSFFLDGGLIWDSAHQPDLKWKFTSPDDRIPLISTGISLRINVLGYMVVEPYYAIPFQNGGIQNASFGLNFLPGW